MSRRHRFRTYRPASTFRGTVIRCICFKAFSTSRELRAHEERCAEVRKQRAIDERQGSR